MILRKITRPDMASALKAMLFLVHLFSLPEVTFSEYVYPDGGRNVIPLMKPRTSRPEPYNEGVVMAHVIGSGGMNFLYLFHVLGVACENRHPRGYQVVQKDFESCVNKLGALPTRIMSQPLGSIQKPCVDWAIHQTCYRELAAEYDECLIDNSGRRKGTDALKFTYAFAKSICRNQKDTDAHLLDRYMRHDLIVPGVFQCFPSLQDKIANCIKKDKAAKTLCSKFYIVHACFGTHYNDDNCPDVQPIYYMDELFRNMSRTLNCPRRDDDWYPPTPTKPPPTYTYRPPVTGGWSKPTHTHRPPITTGGWPSPRPPSYRPPTKGGWSSGEDYFQKETPWPGDQDRVREPIIVEDQRYLDRQPSRPSYSNGRDRDWGGGRGKEQGIVVVPNYPRDRERIRGSGERGRVIVLPTSDRIRDRDRGSGERGRVVVPERNRANIERVRIPNYGGGGGGMDRGRVVFKDRGGKLSEAPPARKPYSDRSERPSFMDTVGRGNSPSGGPWSQRKTVEVGPSRGRGGGGISSPGRDRLPSLEYDSRSIDRGISAERGDRYSERQRSSMGPQSRMGPVSVTLPPAGFAKTRASNDYQEEVVEDDGGGDQKYTIIRNSDIPEDELEREYNFYSLEQI